MSAPGDRNEADPKRHHVWVSGFLACALLGAGVLGSQAAAESVAKRNSEKSHEALALSSAEVGSALGLAIQREEDLVVNATGFFLENPFPTNDQFQAWSETVQAMKRHPELLGWGEVVMITSEVLNAYLASAAADPSSPIAGGLEIVPQANAPTTACSSSARAGVLLLPEFRCSSITAREPRARPYWNPATQAVAATSRPMAIPARFWRCRCPSTEAA